MNKFKVCDLVIANTGGYSVTNPFTVCKVVCVYSECSIWVQVVRRAEQHEVIYK